LIPLQIRYCHGWSATKNHTKYQCDCRRTIFRLSKSISPIF